MTANQFGNSTFPFVLGQVSDGVFIHNVTQTFLSDQAKLTELTKLAANRLFFFGAYPGPLGGPTGEIGQVATHNFFQLDVSNTMFAGASNLAGFNQQVDVLQYINFTPRKFHDANNEFFTLSDSNFAGVVITVAASNSFNWISHEDPYDALKRTYPASNTFFSSPQTVTVGRFEDAYNTYAYVQTLDTVGTDFGGDITQGFIKQHTSFRVQDNNACPEKEYTPFVGESGDNTYPAVSTTAPTLGTGTLTLTHPRVTPTTTLVLKNPEFGNADVLRFAKVDRTTRGGDRKIFADLGWASTQSFELEIVNLCDMNVTIDNILDFLNTSLGEEVGLLDWEGRQWAGIVVVPETEVIPTVNGHTVRIVFEGELVGGPPAS